MTNYDKNDASMITRKELLQLADIQSPHCVSIFTPTHRAGEEALTGKDALILKNQLKEVESKLRRDGMTDNEIEAFVKPIFDLINDTLFWRHQSDGLAIFLADGVFHAFSVPVNFDSFNYVSNEFYIKPIIPLFSGDDLFYVLTLKKDKVRFYQCTKHTITDIKIDDLVPSQLADRVGYDHEQKSLQFRTQQGNHGAGVFHGHEDANSKEKVELKQYFQAIDKGITQMLNEDQKAPMVVACLDFYFPIYQEANTYSNLFSKHIAGNPNDKDIMLIHEKARNLLQNYFDKSLHEKHSKFIALFSTEKTSVNIEEILPAAIDGKIDTLFVQNDIDIYGTYDPTNRRVKIENSKDASNVSLINLLAKRALKNGGDVYLMDGKDMPEKSSSLNALFRY